MKTWVKAQIACLYMAITMTVSATSTVYEIDGLRYGVRPDCAYMEAGVYVLGATDAVTETVTIPAEVMINGETLSVTGVDAYAFKGCKSLKSVILPPDATIGNHAFENCLSLTDVNFENVKSILPAAFRNCVSLKEAIMPNLVDLFHLAFKGCSGLCNVVIGSEGLVTYRWAEYDYYADNFDMIYGDSDPNYIPYDGYKRWYDDDSANINVQVFVDCDNLKTFTVLSELKTLYCGAVEIVGARPLYMREWTDPEFTIDEMVSMFNNCPNLTSLNLPTIRSLNLISGMSNGLPALTDITLSPNLNDIYGCKMMGKSYVGTFSGSPGILFITCPNVIPPHCPKGCFDCDLKQITLTVPEQSVELYRAAETWGEMQIVGVKFAGNTDIETDAIDADAGTEYYDLRGIKVSEPIGGVYIMRNGNKTTRVVMK